ncbi:MAG: hypothetical protein AAGJ18_04060 [Bacteroidota bacterium]
MARVKLTDDLKKAISGLSHKEKDKLLFRLIAKESILAEQLVFKLLESGTSAEDRREDLGKEIEQYLTDYQKYFYSPGYLLLELRNISGKITQHVKTTKDKYGEVYLNFLMLNQSLSLFGEKIAAVRPHRSRTLNKYVVNRAIKLIGLVRRLHEDYRLDFSDAMIELGEHIQKIDAMKRMADDFELDLELLLSGSVDY